MPDPTLTVNASLIQDRIAKVRAGIPSHVEIMAVSKGYSIAHIEAAYAAGIRHFGESRLQEAQPKIATLRPHYPDIIWHLIGHLQTNKAKLALDLFDWIDSVDSLKLAQLLDQRAQTLGIHPPVCLQIKLAEDPNKYGWGIPDLWEHLPQLCQLQALHIQGLMTILPLGLTDPQVLHLFQQLPPIAATLIQRSQGILNPTVFSMGMSSDYPLAIPAGSTQIRLGRSLFADALA